jgi:dolichol-phosphate mannosyltransferase
VTDARTLVFTATYNEADNVGRLVERVFAELPGAHVLVVDDNSPDGTGRLLQRLEREVHPGVLHVLVRPHKLGVGSAHKLAVKFALAEGFERLITMDADFSHDPAYLPLIADLLEEHDFVIGSRYVDGGRCEYGPARRWFSRTANLAARGLLNIPLKETTTSYRGFRHELLRRLDVDSIRGDGYSYFVECSYRIARLNGDMVEFPIDFVDRRAGTTKISKAEIGRAALTLAKLSAARARRRSGVRPGHADEDPVRDAVPCNACGSVYHVEKYPASASSHPSVNYSCTSLAHSSHGRIVRCLGCGLVFTSPQLPEEAVTALYEQVEDPTYLAHADARTRTFLYNLGKIEALLPDEGRLLDVGSYTGTFLEIARGRGYDVMGVEPSVWAARYANESLGIPTVQGTLADLPPDAGRFDVVCSWDVLEHVSDPMSELMQINGVTKLHGLFAFSTLNVDAWPPRILGERWPWMMDMHLYYFNETIVEEMLARAGFELRYVGTYCHIVTSEYLLRKLDSLGVVGAGLARGLVRRTALAHAYVPFRLGDIQLFVAEKIRELPREPDGASTDRVASAAVAPVA